MFEIDALAQLINTIGVPAFVLILAIQAYNKTQQAEVNESGAVVASVGVMGDVIGNLQTQINDMRKELDRYIQQNRQLIEENAQLRTTVNSLTLELGSMTALMHEQSQENEKLRSKIADMQRRIDQLTEVK